MKVLRTNISVLLLVLVSSYPWVSATRGSCPEPIHTGLSGAVIPGIMNYRNANINQSMLDLSGIQRPIIIVAATSASGAQATSGSSQPADNAAEPVDDTAEAARAYKIANCGQYGDTYCANNCVTCNSSGQVVKKSGCARFNYCDECFQTCSCV